LATLVYHRDTSRRASTRELGSCLATAYGDAWSLAQQLPARADELARTLD
jgi:hypothetical protein